MAIDRSLVLRDLIDENGSHTCLDVDFKSVVISAYIDSSEQVTFYSNVGGSYNIGDLHLNITIGYDENLVKIII